MHKRYFSVSSVAALLLSAALLPMQAQTPAAKKPKHLEAAEALLKDITPEHTYYKHKEPEVAWKTNDAAVAVCNTDCSGLINTVLMRSYPAVDDNFFRTVLGQKRPQAKSYLDAIVKGKQFTWIKAVKDVKPGDIIAIKYPPGGENTGHVMLVAEAPKQRSASKPVVDGTEQWEITVIDSSMSGHGPTDTRHKEDGKFRNGLGRGVLRLYANAAGELAGYSWSTVGASEYCDQSKRQSAIGRLALTEKSTNAKP